MGEVHLAVARGAAGFEKMVAIKMLDERLVRDPDVARAFLREAFLGVHLDHQHIVSILDLGEEQGRFYVVMEYVRGYSLAHVLTHFDEAKRAMPLPAAMHVARVTCDALAYLHALRGSDGQRLGLVHGDVSPSNVLIGADGRVKLTDFGLASLETDPTAQTVAGKLPYLPPEALAGSKPTQAWDVYALAALLYESLAGVRAFPATTIAELRDALRDGAAPLRDRRPDVPVALSEVLERALAFHPQRRYGSVAQLAMALEAAVPRQLGDADELRDLVGVLFTDPGFVQQHGDLPSTGGFSVAQEKAVLLDSTQVAPKTMGRVRPRPLRFGITPALGAGKARDVATRFSRLLTLRLTREVRPVVLGDYSMLVDCLVDGEIDFAWTPPTAFASAAERGAGLLAKMVRAGQTTYRAALITRADSSIQEVADLRGKEVAWVDRDSASGYLFPMAELRRVLGDPDTALGEQHFLGSHRAVCDSVANGWAQAGATFVNRTDDGTILSSSWGDHLGERASSVRPIWVSRPIPADGIAHRPFLPPESVAELSNALIDLSSTEEGRATIHEIFHAERFVAADVADYDDLIRSMSSSA
jgi:phosphate/phosphite/phosphonate ABC transporter binding protein